MLNHELDDGKLRVFRIFLASVPQEDLPALRLQLEREVTARQECDNNAVRLFLSSLTAPELETARQAIDFECTPVEFRPPPVRKPAVRVRRVRKTRARKPKAENP